MLADAVARTASHGESPSARSRARRRPRFLWLLKRQQRPRDVKEW